MNLKKELIIRILAVHFNLRFLLFTPKICQICQVAELWCLGNHTKSYNSCTKPNKYTAQGFSRTLSTEMAFILCSDHSFFNNFIGISIIFEKKFFFHKEPKKTTLSLYFGLVFVLRKLDSANSSGLDFFRNIHPCNQ